MITIKYLIFIIFMGMISITACGVPPSSTEANGSETEIESYNRIEAATPPIDVCEPLDIPGVTFPRQEYVVSPREMGAAELVGKLEIVDGILQVDSLYGDGRVILVWPAEFTLAMEGDQYAVLNGEGILLIRTGEEVYMGGGEGNELGMLKCVRQQIPEGYRGKFWYVGDGIRPNLRFDSELFSLSVITSTEKTALLLTKKPILDEWKESPTTITGKFVLYSPMRCPRIHAETGMTLTDYLPIWPPGYTMEFNDAGELQIKDATGKLIATEGDELILSGGGIPHRWDSDKYRQMYYNLPQDCHAPHFIVDE